MMKILLLILLLVILMCLLNYSNSQTKEYFGDVTSCPGKSCESHDEGDVCCANDQWLPTLEGGSRRYVCKSKQTGSGRFASSSKKWVRSGTC